MAMTRFYRPDGRGSRRCRLAGWWLSVYSSGTGFRWRIYRDGDSDHSLIKSQSFDSAKSAEDDLREVKHALSCFDLENRLRP